MRSVVITVIVFGNHLTHLKQVNAQQDKGQKQRECEQQMHEFLNGPGLSVDNASSNSWPALSKQRLDGLVPDRRGFEHPWQE